MLEEFGYYEIIYFYISKTWSFELSEMRNFSSIIESKMECFCFIINIIVFIFLNEN